MSKSYDRTEAIAAMYDLKVQGFDDIEVAFSGIGKDRPLMIRCNPGFSTKGAPEIRFDDIESWDNFCDDNQHNHTDNNWHEGFNREWEYWWIFD